MVIGNEYFRRQAATLLRLAKTTTDASTAAALLERAAKFKSQVDKTPDIEHDTPLAPDFNAHD